ncbi:MAG: hypothetical protein ABSE59_10635 [Opitutaceae bacterium]|jgi:hypothetical protein
MANDPDLHFDQTVMEMIEHSPTGILPVTPSYQDALKRLYAAHQVYPDADHKGGHVTARSLAKLPSFHANNLDAFIAGQIGAEALESNASIFDRYSQSLPSARRAAAESVRAVVAGRPALHRAKGTHDPVHTLFLVPGTGPHPGLPGNYLYGSAWQVSADAETSPWAVHLHDSGDGAVLFDAPTRHEALAKLQEVLECAPFNMNELEALGFRFN